MENHGGEFSQVLQNSYGSVDRVPQWSFDETQNFLVIRAELDQTFMETKRNKLLWELLSARMNEIGYTRSPIQCKCKWKNLVTRYKGCESIQELEMRQWTFPFYNEMQIIFNARTQRMMCQDMEGGGAAAVSSQKSPRPSEEQYPSDDEDGREKKKKKKRKEKAGGESSMNITGGGRLAFVDGLKGIIEEMMNQQMEMEMQWIKAYEEREARRREREVKWRQRMEAMESERFVMMMQWREREEQRKKRQEARAVRTDALVTTLLNKIKTKEN